MPLISPSHRHSSIKIPSKSLYVRHETTRVLDCQMLSVVRTNVEYFSTSSSGNGGKCSRVRDQEPNFPVDSSIMVFGTHWATRIFVPPSRQNRSIRHPTGKYQWASGRIFCTPSSPVHMTFTFMAKRTCQNRLF